MSINSGLAGPVSIQLAFCVGFWDLRSLDHHLLSPAAVCIGSSALCGFSTEMASGRGNIMKVRPTVGSMQYADAILSFSSWALFCSVSRMGFGIIGRR